MDCVKQKAIKTQQEAALMLQAKLQKELRKAKALHVKSR
jgi:hypothetical protein